VQGHVDTVARCLKIDDRDGSWEFKFEIPKAFQAFIIEKGSISLNGISLTTFDVKMKSFRVAVIPYTYEHTNMSTLGPGTLVNLEFDLIGKYASRLIQVAAKNKRSRTA
jgi:riboflavin synthase